MSIEDTNLSQLSFQSNLPDSSSAFVIGEEESKGGEDEWEECFDDDSQLPYWFNSIDGTSTWEDPLPGNGCLEDILNTAADTDPNGIIESTKNFTCPPLVPKRWTDFGNSILFHGNPNPSPFFRVNVFQAQNPYREAFKPSENVDHSVWSKKMILYTFAKEMPNTVYYSISYAMNPYRTRVLPTKLGSQLKRDISKWGKSKVEEEQGFWAFPVSVPGRELFYVDWTSSPDRYSITTRASPEWQWTRCFR